MSQPPRRYWDPDSRQYYWYNEHHDTLHFDNGNVVQRPKHIPRTSFASNASQTPASGTDYGQGSSHYSLETVTQRLQDTSLQDSPQRQYNPAPIRPNVDETGGVRRVYVADPRTGVRTFFQDSPAEQITDPFLLGHGITARRRLLAPDESVAESLFDSYRRRPEPKKFFTVGKAFLVLWVEPAGESIVTSFEPGTTLGLYGERVFSKVRRFVVIREGDNYCTCLPIVSYGKQGVGKRGVNKSEHSIVYTGRTPPDPQSTELPVRGELGMRSEAIRIDVDDPIDKLDNVSRIDYGKVYTIQHNIKVKNFGKVNPNSMSSLVHQFGNVWNSQPVISMTNTVRRSSETANSARARRKDSHSGPSRLSTDSVDAEESSKTAGKRAVTSAPQDPQYAAQAAIVRLMKQGLTQKEAMNQVRAAYQKQRQAQAEDDEEEDKDDDQDEEDDDEEDEEDDEDGNDNQDNDNDNEEEDNADDDLGNARPQSQNLSKGRRSEGSRHAPPSSSQKGSRSGTSSHSQHTLAPQSQQRDTRTTGSSSRVQPGSSRTAAHGHGHGQSHSVASSSRAPSTSSAQSQRDQAMRAMMTELIGQGYKQEDATERVRAHFSSQQHRKR